MFALAVLTGCVVGPHPPAASPRDDWAPLTWEQRHDAMTFLVLPNMGRLFQRFDGKASPDLTCRTCHGVDAERVAYAMPHGLPALDAHGMPDASMPIVRFMTDEVTPTMADLLGVDRGRFTCFGCHPRKS